MILTENQQQVLQQVLLHFPNEQLYWLSGYLSAKISSTNPVATPQIGMAIVPNAANDSEKVLTILFGTQSGNSKKVATQAAAYMTQKGWQVTVKNMKDYVLKSLVTEKNLWIVVSTHGEGVPPIAAEDWYDFIHSKKAPKLPQLRFAVVALGDSSYVNFGKVGKDIDQRLEQLGGTRLLPCVVCDVDYESSAEQWWQQAAEKLPSVGDSPTSTTFVVSAAAINAPAATVYSRKNPFLATLTEKIQLNGRGSAKQTYHIELSLDGSNMRYEVGDSLGILPNNPLPTVEALLSCMSFDPQEIVQHQDESLSLMAALTHYLEITTLHPKLVEKYNQLAQSNTLANYLQQPNELKNFCYGRDVIDLLRDFPVSLTAQALVTLLTPLTPRLYSIASSLTAYPDEVHLTVGAVQYENQARKRYGCCSTYLQYAETEQKIPVYVDSNEVFRLPNDPQSPIIMVGAGTGIAPFRAFVQERAEQENAGKSWLFFGNPHFATDFLYQTEWLKYLKNKQLTQMNVAFSRDTAQKMYVQHQLQKNARQLYEWLEAGAYFYVCGDMNKMAKDVHHALIDIVQQEQKCSHEAASNYVKQLRKQQRYLEDVY
ncbi:MAG: assimilatory sulfite reductase (NADPH) flavoprotein subunit [Chitinophagales bacterium]|nr:assimilatory sulfite reductase (NADPH) flavoprotein subunit [Chitinophagales bacterium]